MNQYFVNDPERAFRKTIPSEYQIRNGRWTVVFSIENKNDLVELRVAGTTYLVKVRKGMIKRDIHTGEKYIMGNHIGEPSDYRINLEWPWLPETRVEGRYIGDRNE